MKILVTGGAGFIGSHLVEALVAEQYQVVVVDNLSTGSRAKVHPAATFIFGDIRSLDLRKILQQERVDIVFHLAAQTSVQVSLAQAYKDAETNIQGSVRLLEACVQAGVSKVIYASSAAVYGQPQYLGIDEAHPTVPTSPYGISKLTPEYYLRVYLELYGLRYTILRYANVYGPGQGHSECGVIAEFIRNLARGQSPIVFGTGEQTRDYVYVDDVVRVNLATLDPQGDGKTFNIGTGKATTVNELLVILQHILGTNTKPKYQPARSGEIEASYMCTKRVRTELGWWPKTEVREGLELLVNKKLIPNAIM